MQAQRQAGYNFDQMGENQSVVSNNVITDSCTNKRSKPEMASESQLGLRSHQFQVILLLKPESDNDLQKMSFKMIVKFRLQ